MIKKTKVKKYRQKWQFSAWGAFFLLLGALFLAQFILLPPTNYFKKEVNNPFKPTSLKLQPTTLPQKITPVPAKSFTSHSGYQLRVPILMYHYIGYNPDPSDKARDILATNPDKFKQQMRYLSQQGYQTVSLDTLYAALKQQTTLPAKPIILTFDDGYEDFYTNAYPILQEFNYKATVFIPTGLIEKTPYLTWPQIQLMSTQGLITFGAHTVNHYNLTAILSDESWTEISQSKEELQDRLGIPINFFSYPGGSLNNLVVSQVQKAGFIGAVGTWSSHFQSEGTIYNMPRIRINGLIDLKIFAELL